MGQRLVITVHAFDEDVAKIYYHWSAYTVSALYEANSIINGVDWKNAKNVRDLQHKLIRFVEEAGGCIDGGMNGNEYKEIQKMFPESEFKNDGSRNNGLIALTENGMSDLEFWSEGDLTINFDDEEIYNGVVDCYESLDEVNDYNDWRDEPLTEDDFADVDGDFVDIKFEDLDHVLITMNTLWHNGQFEFKTNGMYYVMIA